MGYGSGGIPSSDRFEVENSWSETRRDCKKNFRNFRKSVAMVMDRKEGSLCFNELGLHFSEKDL